MKSVSVSVSVCLSVCVSVCLSVCELRCGGGGGFQYATVKDGSAVGVTHSRSGMLSHCRALTVACNYTEGISCHLSTAIHSATFTAASQQWCHCTLHRMCTDGCWPIFISSSFLHVKLSSKFAINPSLKSHHSVNCVATLPCEWPVVLVFLSDQWLGVLCHFVEFLTHDELFFMVAFECFFVFIYLFYIYRFN